MMTRGRIVLVAVLAGIGAWWLARRERGAGPASLPERAFDRAKDATAVVAETAGDLTQAPGEGDVHDL
jgi:hypothetical protein